MSASAAPTAILEPMTTAEFLVWESGDDLRWQLVDGELVAMAPTIRSHGAIVARLTTLLSNHLDGLGGRCTVVGEPGIVPKIRSNYNFRIPDLGVTCTPYEVEETDLSNPILLAEVLSKSNERQTRRNVWTYTSLPSVQEVLLVRSTRIGAELFRRRADGGWPDDPTMLGEDALLELASIDFAVPLRAVYAGTRFAPPSPATV